jgi:pimeloyl-ACP methyl ester carboxylesterase
MTGYVQLGGVRTWFAEYGEGEPVVLVHPGGTDSRAWTPNLDTFSARFRVFAPDRRGHGRTPDIEGPITYELMAQDMIAFLQTTVGQAAHLVGRSDGAIVALLVALHRPDLVRRMVLVSGVFHHDGWAPGVLDADDATTAFLAASYGEVSPDGPGHYPVVAAKTHRMHAQEPTLLVSDLNTLRNRTLVMVGDDDEVRLEHAIAMYRNLPDAELAVVPGTSHGLLNEKPPLCHTIIIDFLTTEPVSTIAPLRRASSAQTR